MMRLVYGDKDPTDLSELLSLNRKDMSDLRKVAVMGLVIALSLILLFVIYRGFTYL